MLTAEDLVNLGAVSSKESWYDSSIRFYRAAKTLLEQKNDTSVRQFCTLDLSNLVVEIN